MAEYQIQLTVWFEKCTEKRQTGRCIESVYRNTGRGIFMTASSKCSLSPKAWAFNLAL